MRENENTEFKKTLVDNVKKCVVAFANSVDGGTLYIGVDDDGAVVGVDDADKALLSVNNMLRDSIKPDVTLFAQSRIEQMNGLPVIAIEIQSGTEKPYYLTEKGVRPEGVYVRHGAASVPATESAIRKMLRDTDGDSYEKTRSIEQTLTFAAAESEFTKRNVEFGASQFVTLGLSSVDGVYSNLGLLLSEQSVHTVKCAVFQDNTQQAFKDRREFGGSLFKQINEVYDYLDLHNQTAAKFVKLLRIDTRDYPEAALREALLNSVIHREYAVSGSILIKVYSDRAEFISPGGLVTGIEVEDIMSGYSICRNQNLAAVFYRLGLIEAYGTGILKIYECYKGSHSQPKIEVTPNIFKLTLPNLNDAAAKFTGSSDEAVMRFAYEHGSISRKQAEKLLGVSQTAAGIVLRRLTDNGQLAREGNSRNLRYFVRDELE
jgi:ATP-dependent DNA helicase RecG